MSVIDSITNTTRTAFSFEVLPPLKGTGINSLFRTIDELREFDPKYINITTHRSEYVYQESPEGVFHKVSLRRRPGTVAVAAAIKNRYDIPVVPHILCSGFTREETEYVLLDLQFLGNTYNPNLGSAISLVLMVIVLLCMSIVGDTEDETMGGRIR